MGNQLKERDNISPWRRAIWVFCKAQISAQFATFVDFLVTILLAKVFALFYLYATFIGSVVGGAVNCSVNYGWVFHAKDKDCKKRHVAVKYLFVWTCSILLNTWGTYILTEWLDGVKWIVKLTGASNVFILSKIVIAVLVAFFWNYQLQRLFVYRNRDIRGFVSHFKH